MKTNTNTESKLQSRTEPSSTAEMGLARINFARRRVNRSLDTEALLAVLRGTAPRFFELAEVVGQRLACPLPQGHYQTSTLIAAVRLKGPQAPWLFGGPRDGELFLAWVQQGLVPCLQRDDLVVLDNLATHKVAGVREAVEAAGARPEYLPPYSPDFNPIENRWSKVKQALKGRAPRNAGQLLKAASVAFAAVTPIDCQGFFLHAGYPA